MMTELSTTRPKSMAPRLIRLPAMPSASMRSNGEEHRERDGRGDDQAGAEVAEEDEEHGDDEERALEQVRRARCASTLVDQVGPLVDRVDLDARREALLDLLQAQPAGGCVTSWLFSPISMKPRPSTTSPLPSAVTAPRRISRPSTTAATSRTRIGTPSRGGDDDLARRRSSARDEPTPWTRLDSPA